MGELTAMYGIVDETLWDHPKTLALLDEPDGLEALGLWTAVLIWARGQCRPDNLPAAGTVPPGLVRRIAGDKGKHLAALLVSARAGHTHGLWEDADGDGWRIHDFADWQQLASWAARSQAGRRGAEGRWGSRDGSLFDAGANAGDGDPHMPSDAGASAEGDDLHMPSGSTAMPQSKAKQSTSKQDMESQGLGPPKRATRLPEGWRPSRELLAWAAQEAPGVDVRRETAKFTDYWLGLGGERARKIDWDRTWRNWIRKAAEHQPGSRHQRGTAPRDDQGRDAEWLGR